MLKGNTKYEILTPTGFQNFNGVQVIKKKVLRFECEDHNVVCEVSVGHKFYIDGAVLLSDDVVVGDNLFHKDVGYVAVTNIIEKDIEDVYDVLDVEGGNIFFANNILHHNCEFIGSSNTVLNSVALERLFTRRRGPEFLEMKDKFRVYEHPVPGAKYVMGVDTAKGTGENSSVIQVLKIESLNPVKMTQVAVWQDNFTDVYTFSSIVNRVSYYYNHSYIMCENNGEGAPVVNRIWWDFENENLINTGAKNKDLGIRATRTTKPQAVLLMKKLIEDKSVDIPDEASIIELADFQDLGNDKFGGVNMGDDLVCALYWALYLLEFDILDEEYTFAEEIDEDGWGILSDVDTGIEEDWSWLTDK